MSNLPGPQFLFFRFTASLSFRAASVCGLDTLHRQGDAVLELDGDWLTLQTAFAVDQIQVGPETMPCPRPAIQTGVSLAGYGGEMLSGNGSFVMSREVTAIKNFVTNYAFHTAAPYCVTVPVCLAKLRDMRLIDRPPLSLRPVALCSAAPYARLSCWTSGPGSSCVECSTRLQ